MSQDSIASKTYDLTPKEREILEWKAQRRLELRNQYLREIHNPNSGEHVFDPQVQRQYTANFSYEKIWKPNVRNFMWFTGILFGSWASVYFWVKNGRDAQEYKYRTGQISYRDREAKFV